MGFIPTQPVQETPVNLSKLIKPLLSASLCTAALVSASGASA